MPEIPYYIPLRLDRDIAEVFSYFATRPNAFFLDSAMHGRPNSRYSFFGFSPHTTFESSDGLITINDHTFIEDPLNALKHFVSRTHGLPRDPYQPFYAGLIGYVGFEWGTGLQKKKDIKDHASIPDAWFGLYDTIVTYDHVEGIASISSIGLTPDFRCDEGLARERCEALAMEIKNLPKESSTRRLRYDDPIELCSANTFEEYLNSVRLVKQHIRDGECTYATLSQRFHTPLRQSPWAIHNQLRNANPTPYAAFLNCGHFHILTTSPTCFLQTNESEIVSKPVLSSRPRSQDPETDRRTLRELLLNLTSEADAITKSEVSNLKSVCEEGSIEVDKPTIESDSKAHHLITIIKAKKKGECDMVDCLSALMPASSVLGTPRNKAAQLLSKYEPVRRQVYTGAIGYIGLNGKSQFNVAVRTMLLRDCIAYLHAGTPIELETDPKEAYQKVRGKANELLTAISHSPVM